MKKITKTIAKRRAWKIFSEYIRFKHSSMGIAECYTCGALKHYKDIQAGHGIGGRSNAVLFLEEVVRPQCVGCNVFGRGKQSIFTMKLIKELGMKKYERLVALSNEIVQYKLNDYTEIARKYTDKLKELQGI